jgi:hypothetical protein
MVLRNLKQFIRVHRNEGEAGEVRAYLLTHADAIAEAFAVETSALLEAVAKVDDDDKLCRFALGSIATAQEKGSAGKRDARVSDAQASADVIGSVARVYPWGAAEIDLLSLLDHEDTHSDGIHGRGHRARQAHRGSPRVHAEIEMRKLGVKL